MAEEEAPVAESPPDAAKKKKKEKRAPKDPLSLSGVTLGLLRRPLLVLVGAVACGLALAIESAFGSTQNALFNLISYVPFLGGGWAVLARATSTDDMERGHLPSRSPVLAFVATAVVVVVLSGLARVTLTVLGELVVKTALALGPTVALADSSWPHRALWRGLMVIDESPADFLRVTGISIAILLLTVAVVPFALREVLGLSESAWVQGFARGLGWGLISAFWMRYYLRVRPRFG